MIKRDKSRRLVAKVINRAENFLKADFSFCLFNHLYIYLSIYLFYHLVIYLFVYLFIYSFIYLLMNINVNHEFEQPDSEIELKRIENE